MRKIKSLCILLAVVFVIGSTASAAGVNTIDISKDTYGVFTVEVSYPEDYVGNSSIYIVPKTKLDDAKNGDLSSAVLVREGKLDDSKSVAYDFLMKTGAQAGVYAIVTGEGDSAESFENRTRYFMYSTSNTSGKLNDLNQSAELETQLLAGETDAWYINTQDSAWTGNKAAVLSLLKEFRGAGFDSTYVVEDAFRVACDFANPAATSADEFLADIIYFSDYLSVDKSNTEFVANKKLTASKLKKLAETNAPKNKADISALFTKACALAGVSTATRTTVIDVIKKYNNDVFKLDFSGDYTKIDSYELVKVFDNKDYNTVDAVVSDFNNEVARLKAEDNNPSGGSAGGGGGGGGVVATPVNPSKGDVETGKDIIRDMEAEVVVGTFKDVKSSHWAVKYIEFVYENQIMSGDPNGNFRPDDYITREEWTKVILEAFSVKTEGAQCDFADVSPDAWYYDYVAKAFELDVVNGTSETYFGAGSNIRRQDAVVMLYRLCSMVRDLSGYSEDGAKNFEDAANISDYATKAVSVFADMKVVNGYSDGRFVPEGIITRAEAAKIVAALLDIVG